MSNFNVYAGLNKSYRSIWKWGPKWKGMPRLIEIAKEVLGDVIANALNTEGCSSVEEFLKRYELIRDTNEHTVGEQVH